MLHEAFARRFEHHTLAASVVSSRAAAARNDPEFLEQGSAMERLDLRRSFGDVTLTPPDDDLHLERYSPLTEAEADAVDPRGLDVLRERLEMGTATIGVVGLGYVGLPLLVMAASQGFPVIGVDADERKIESLERGESYIVDVTNDELQSLVLPRFTSSSRALLAADVVIVAVPTPLRDGGPDLSLVLDAARSIAQILRPGRLVVLESTTYPGTTEEVVLPVLENSGLKAGLDFALGYSPERIDPGSGRTLYEVPKIVSGVGAEAGDLVELLYRKLGCPPVRAPSPRVAEMAKLIENTFRQVNIALVNELATVAADLDVDIWAALDAAATKPFGYMAFWPGPGVGGHCIAIDPSYLSWRAAQRRGFGIGFVQHALEVNNSMPQYTAGRIGDALNHVGKPLKGPRSSCSAWDTKAASTTRASRPRSKSSTDSCDPVCSVCTTIGTSTRSRLVRRLSGRPRSTTTCSIRKIASSFSRPIRVSTIARSCIARRSCSTRKV